MPYTATNELPDGVRHALPAHAQAIYKEAFNSAYQEYKSAKDRKAGTDREGTAHRVAWSAVKQSYRKGTDGKWHRKALY